MSAIQYIGHGRLESSPENFSILHVVAHELAHVQEFKNEAFRENADIAEIRVSIDYELKDNGKLVAVSGETTAVTRKKPEDSDRGHGVHGNHKQNSARNFDPNDPLYQPYSPKDRTEASEGAEGFEASSGKKADEWNRLSRQERLENRLQEVETQLNYLNGYASNGGYVEAGSGSGTDSNWDKESQFAKNLEIQKEELEREKQKVQDEIRLLRMEAMTKKNFEFLMQAQRDLVSNVLGLAGIDPNDLSANPFGYSGSLLDAQA